MSDTPSVEHRGYKITYSENQDVWRCWDINYESAKLSLVKQKIDAVERQHRKLAAPALYITHGGAVKDCVIVSLDEDRDRCFITTGETGTDRWGRPNGTLKRDKVSLSQIAADTPENRELARVALEKQAAYEAAQAAATAARKAIPRLTREDLLARGVAKESDAA